MHWSEEKDIILAREIAISQIFSHRSGSREKGLMWQSITDNLNAYRDLNFMVSGRSVHDRFTLLTRKHKSKTAKEIRGSGISVEDPTELEQLIEDLVQLSEEAELKFINEAEVHKKSQNADQEKAMDIRKTAMEKLGETRKRTSISEDDESPKNKVKRRSGSDAMDFLQEKLKNDKILQENKARERADAKQMHEDNLRANNEMLRTFQQNMAQQAQQSNAMQQQMMGIMAQQSQSFQLMMKFMEKSNIVYMYIERETYIYFEILFMFESYRHFDLRFDFDLFAFRKLFYSFLEKVFCIILRKPLTFFT